MQQSVSQSKLLSLQNQLTQEAIKTPEDEIRKIIQDIVSPETLPSTKKIQLYYVRGVVDKDSGVGNIKNPISVDDENIIVSWVEFVYLLDVEYPTIPAVVLCPKIRGSGYPDFPDFSNFEVRSILRQSEPELVFPSVPGNLLITVQPNTDEETVKNGLASYVTSINQLNDGTYLAKVKPFHEPVFIQKIENNVPFVKYAQTDRIARPFDFLTFPTTSWRVNRVC